MTSLNESQKRYKILFENHVNTKTGNIFDKEFERDILKLRNMGKAMTHHTVGGKGWSKYPALFRFIWKHKLALPMYDFLYHFALDGTIDFTKIRTGIFLEDDDTLKLVISPDATKKQIKDFIDEHWQDIRKAQAENITPLYPDGKAAVHINAERDYRMLELAETTKKLNDVAAKIAQEYHPYSPTPRDISKTKYRLKKRNIPV